MEISDDELQEPEPPNTTALARRALILCAICYRGFVDTWPVIKNDPDPAIMAHDWLKALSLETDLSAWEARLFSQPLGTLDQQDLINATWLSEGRAVLAWALGLHPMPAFDEPCDPAAVSRALGFLSRCSDTVLAQPQLRPMDELRDDNEFVYNVHWRLRDFSLKARPYDFESLAKEAWGDPVIRFGLRLNKKDLDLGRLPLGQSGPEAYQPLLGLTQERHRPSNWLIGYRSSDYYGVTTDT